MQLLRDILYCFNELCDDGNHVNRYHNIRDGSIPKFQPIPILEFLCQPIPILEYPNYF